MEGTNPIGDTGLTCQYNLRKNFTPTGFYIGRDTVTHEPKKIAITFPAVKVSGVVDVKRSGSNVVLDGSDLLQVANIRWYTGETFDTLASSDSKFTLKTENQEQYVCLSLAAPSQKRESCARIFAIRPKVDSPITGTIQYEVDPTDSTKYAFRIVDLKTKTGGEIERIAWYLDDTIPMGNDESAEKSFPSYGTYKVSAEITDSAGNKVTLSEKITLQKPLQLVKKSGSDSLLSVKDQSGNQLLKNAYDRELGAYRIENFQTPQKIMFDATDVRVKNDGFELKEVSWKIGNEERKGMKLEYDFVEERRYEVTVQYIFVKTGTTEEVSVTEKIVLEGKAKEIMPALSMSSEGQADLDNLYAPARITFDASASRVRSGKIAQFIFDFGEGKPASEGEAVKTYQYTIP